MPPNIVGVQEELLHCVDSAKMTNIFQSLLNYQAMLSAGLISPFLSGLGCDP